MDLSQDEVARTAKASWGLGWRPATVAAVEAGRRKLSVVELLLLPNVLMAAAVRKGRRVMDIPSLRIDDLVPEVGMVELVPGTRARADAIRALLRGEDPDIEEPDWTWYSTPQMRRGRAPREARATALRSHLANAGDVEQMAATIWPSAPRDVLLTAALDAVGEAERKAASRLGIPSGAVALTALKLWKRSFSDERNHRVTHQAGVSPSRRTLQALRGHVARGLLKELRDELRPKLPTLARAR
jgi:hypothetical protein